MGARSAAASVVAALLLAAACTGGNAGEDGDPRLQVVTSVSPITNIVANVAGDAAEVTGVVPEGEDSHTFDPPPSVARLLARADVVFVNGLNLETQTIELAERILPDRGEMVALGEEALGPDDYIFDFSFPRAEGGPNPHTWTNPPYVKAYASIVRDVLVRRDPGSRATYERNHDRFARRVDELDAALREAVATVPPERRRLVTYHDSFPYFARDYGWEVVGAVQPSDFSEPSPREVARLIEQVRAEGVPAIFGSEVFPSPVLETIAAESGARYVDDLRDDDLPGEPGNPEHSLLALLVFDYRTIVTALGGDASALDRVDTLNVVRERAMYA